MDRFLNMFEARIQTYWADADPAGIVYFPHFFRFVEYSEEELFRSSGTARGQLLDEHNVWLPRVESHANFKKPIHAGDAILVRVRVRFKGEKTVRYDFEIIGEESGQSLADGYVTLVCVDRTRFKARPLPAPLRKAFELACD